MFEFYVRHEWWFAAVQLALAMLGMGATLNVADFVGVFRQPRAFVTGALVQIIGTPLLALALNAALGLPPGIAFGLLLVSAMPGGAMSNVATYFAKGSVALRSPSPPSSPSPASRRRRSCCACWPGDVMRADFVMPVGAIALDIAVCLLVPLLLGMAIGALLGSTARRGAHGALVHPPQPDGRPLHRHRLGRRRPTPGRRRGQTPLAAIALLAVLCQVAGTAPGLLLGLPRAELAAIAIENSIRNTNLALLLKASLFPVVPGVADPLADGVLFAALLYAGLSGPLSIPLILGHRWLARRRAGGAVSQ